MLVFRIFKSAAATNWSLLIRKVNSDGELLRCWVAKVITVTVPNEYNDTKEERKEALQAVDRTRKLKIDDHAAEDKQRSKAAKKKPAASPRREIVPISSMHLNDVAAFRTALKEELAPYAKQLAEATTALKDAQVAFNTQTQLLKATAETVNAIGSSFAQALGKR